MQRHEVLNSSAMKPKTIQKNEARLKKGIGRDLLMAVLMFLCLSTAMVANAQTWNISDGSTSGNNVIAILSGDVLTIKGTGNMADFDATSGGVPWYSQRSSIKTVVMQSGVKNIGNVAFEGCNNLQWITIPEGVTIIGVRAFDGCTSLTAFHIPSSITVIETRAFKSCSALTTIWNRATTPQIIDANIFEGVSLNNKYLVVAAETIEAYKSKDVWKNFTVASQSMLIKLDNNDEYDAVVFDLDGHLQYYKFQNNNPNILEKLVVFDRETYIGETEIPSLVVDFNSEGKPKRYMASDGSKILVDGYGNNTFNATLATTSGEIFPVENISYNISDITNGFSVEEYATKVTERMFRATIHKFMEGGILNAAEIVTKAFKDEFLKTVFEDESMPDAIKVGYRLLTFVKSGTSTATSCGFAGAISPVAVIPILGWVAVGAAYSVCLYDIYQMAKKAAELASSLYDMFNNASNTSCSVFIDLTGVTLRVYGNGALCSSEIDKYKNRENEITKVIIGSGVTEIPAPTFFGYGYANIQEVYIEDGAKILNFPWSLLTGVAFGRSPVKKLYMGRNIKHSGAYNSSPFFSNTDLNSITIGNNVTSIPEECFNGCKGLITIHFGNGLTSIGEGAFNGCENITNALNIPAGVKTIGNYAFAGCEKISSLVIPNSVDSIGNLAFRNCTNMQSVRIENGTKTLFFKIDWYSTFDGSSIGYLYLGRNISFNNSNSPFNNSNSPFNYNTLLTSLSIGNNVTFIPVNCFRSCSGLKTVEFGNGLSSIGDYAFEDCENITNALNIPAGVKTIGNYTFSNCKKISSLVIPSSVDLIGSDAFYACNSLTNVAVNWTIPISIGNVFEGVNKQTCTLCVPTGTITAYKSATGWKDFTNIKDNCGGTTTYTINISTNPSAGGSVSGGGTYNSGMSCSVNATANSGYTFTNWTENSSVVSTSAAYTFNVTANRTLVANFTQNAVTPPTVITQDATNITQTTATLNKSVTAGSQTITAQGFEYRVSGASSWSSSTSGNLTGLSASTTYQFRAYATTASGTTYGNTLSFTTLTTTSVPPNDQCANAINLSCGTAVSGTLVGATPTTFYGNYTTFPDVYYQFTAANTGNHTLTFTKNTSSDDIDAIVYQGCSSKTEVASISENATTETKTFTCTAGTNYRIRVVSCKATAGTFAIKIDCPATYTLTFNAQGGTVSPTSQTVTYGLQVGTLPTPTRTGYTFGGWFTGTSGSGTQYTFSTVYNMAGNITLYAKWTANTYTVTLDRQSGTGGSTSVTAIYDAAMPSATMPTRTGYTLQGYYDATSDGTQYYTSSGASARTWNKTSNATLYARWTANAVTPPTVITQDATNITQTTATLNKSVTAGSQTITAQGFEYRVSGASSWSSSTSGNLTGLSASTSYQFRVYATTASGTTYGNVLTFITLGDSDYLPYRESRHFIFDIPTTYLAGSITPANLGRWMQHMDDAYDAYTNLMGGHTPCNGQKLTFMASDAGYGWLWIYPNSPYIYWNSGYIASDMKEINDKDVWFWGPLHEVGHLFDKNDEPNWIFHGEVTANLKAIYAIDAIPDCHVEMGVMRYSLQDVYNHFYDWSVQDDGNDDRYTDKITLGFIKVAQRYGWNVFTKTFNSYWDNSYPNTSCNAGDAGKYNEFIDRLEYFSGSENIRSECFSTNNWQATIERHYPRNATPTWQIGSPNAADVTASFNCETGTLTISGSGSMQDWIYNHGTLPWASVRTQITSVVINNGVTTIGNNAFLDCISLVSVNMPNSITHIGNNAFLYCNSITSFTITSRVTSIGTSAFQDCTALVSVTNYATTPQNIDANVFIGVNKQSCTLTVPAQSLGIYRQAEVWKDFLSIRTTAIEEVITNQIALYPNPSKHEIFIKSDLPIQKIEICDLSGKQMINSKLQNSKAIDISALKSGVYLVKIYTDNGVIIQKIVKE